LTATSPAFYIADLDLCCATRPLLAAGTRRITIFPELSRKVRGIYVNKLCHRLLVALRSTALSVLFVLQKMGRPESANNLPRHVDRDVVCNFKLDKGFARLSRGSSVKQKTRSDPLHDPLHD
jgi:hypothetical protein